jgi:hypothetical protein
VLNNVSVVVGQDHKLAKLQAKATLSAGWVGAGAAVAAALVSFALGYFVGSSPVKEINRPVAPPAAVSSDKDLVKPESGVKNEQQKNQP